MPVKGHTFILKGPGFRDTCTPPKNFGRVHVLMGKMNAANFPIGNAMRLMAS